MLLSQLNMIECADLLEMDSLFRNVIPEMIFDFLREIGVFYKIWSVLKSWLCEVFLKSCVIFLCGMFYNLFNE